MKQTLIFLAVLSLFAIADASTPIPMNLQVDGVERQALVFPPSNSTGKVPLVFAFHGHGGNANGFAVHAGIQNAWPEALVVYPQGLRIPTDVDPQGLKPGWQRRPGEVGDRDLKFVDAMMTKLREQYPVDEQHIFAVRFSNGAFFTYLLWAKRPQMFAAFAPVAGLPRYSGDPKIPKPAMQIGGRADRLVHIEDVEHAMAMVRELNGCSDPGEPCGPGCMRYSSSKNAPVEDWIHPGPHIYPPRATPLIVNFFKEIAGGHIQDALKQFAANRKSRQAVERKAVELHELYNRDVGAAAAWLKKQPFVDSNRVAVTGVSYGGIQTLLAAEKNLGLRAAIPFAPGAMSWANMELEQREIAAVQDAKVPLFLLQSRNDYSIGPSETLGPIIRKKGGFNRAKLYPPFGTTHAEGHGGFACWEEGIAIWGNDVIDFLNATGMGNPVAASNTR